MSPRWRLTCHLLALTGAVGCQENQSPRPAPAIPAAQPTDTAARAGRKYEPPPPEAGVVVRGTVSYTGTTPQLVRPQKEVDPVCAKADIPDESFGVNPNGTLRNVLVRVTGGVKGTYPVPAERVVIDQKGCLYRPRVQVAQVGQAVLVRNGDHTIHNVHALRGASTLFNKVQVDDQAAPIEWRPIDDESGMLLKLRCDVHPWMTGYVYVSDHPFAAVSGDDGRFQLWHLPEGSYTVEAWHERFGSKTAHLDVHRGKPAELTFSYSGQERPAPQ